MNLTCRDIKGRAGTCRDIQGNTEITGEVREIRGIQKNIVKSRIAKETKGCNVCQKEKGLTSKLDPPLGHTSIPAGFSGACVRGGEGK